MSTEYLNSNESVDGKEEAGCENEKEQAKCQMRTLVEKQNPSSKVNSSFYSSSFI